MSTPILSVSNIFFRVGELSILNGVSFEANTGERLGIIGPNGSGKTTLFNCLSGFSRVSQGEIKFDGVDLTRLAAYQRANLGVGRVFQNFGIFKQLTVVENILVALESKERGILLPWGRKQKELLDRSRHFLTLVGLEGKVTHKAGSLSGGQLRLLEIARTLASDAKIFLLDEPTAGVSPKMKQEVEKIILKLHELNKTILIIEHDLNFIQKLCQRILVLDQGRVVLDGAPDVVRKDKQLQEIYFGNE
jgi:ABC-type branched-subunit amino acid transport system ATPase component